MVIWSQMTIKNEMVNGTDRSALYTADAVPKERSTIARHFNAGNRLHEGTSAEGTAETPSNLKGSQIVPQPSHSGLEILLTRTPGVKTPGYSHFVPAGRRRSPRCCRAFHLCSDAQEAATARNVSLTRPLGVIFTHFGPGCFTLFHLVSPCFTYGKILRAVRARTAQRSVPTVVCLGSWRRFILFQLVSPGCTYTDR